MRAILTSEYHTVSFSAKYEDMGVVKEHLELWGPQLHLVVSRTSDLELKDLILVRSTINCTIWNKVCNLSGSQLHI